MKIVMTLLVRDEEDILAANLAFHLMQGVDFFIVTDNLSEDKTPEIVQSYVDRGLAVYLRETGDDYSQAQWVTRMARMAAASHGADWVINSDADEFWTSADPAGSLRGELASVAPEAEAVCVPRQDFVPVDVERSGFFAERMLFRRVESFNLNGDPLPPKVCHRGDAGIEVDQGNHCVRRAGVPLPAAQAPLRILHYPLRSYEQFARKIAKGGAAYARNTQLPLEAGATWRNMYALWLNNELRDAYLRNLVAPERAWEAVRNGELVYDDTLIRALRRLEQRP